MFACCMNMCMYVLPPLFVCVPFLIEKCRLKLSPSVLWKAVWPQIIMTFWKLFINTEELKLNSKYTSKVWVMLISNYSKWGSSYKHCTICRWMCKWKQFNLNSLFSKVWKRLYYSMKTILGNTYIVLLYNIEWRMKITYSLAWLHWSQL